MLLAMLNLTKSKFVKAVTQMSMLFDLGYKVSMGLAQKNDMEDDRDRYDVSKIYRNIRN